MFYKPDVPESAIRAAQKRLDESTTRLEELKSVVHDNMVGLYETWIASVNLKEAMEDDLESLVSIDPELDKQGFLKSTIAYMRKASYTRDDLTDLAYFLMHTLVTKIKQHNPSLPDMQVMNMAKKFINDYFRELSVGLSTSQELD